MKKQFVTYEIASKLKELSFDEQCLAVYRDRWNDFGITLISQSIEIKGSQSMKLYDISNNEMICLAPLWQQIIDWFREKDIVIEVRRNFPKDQYFYTIGSKTFQHVSESTFNYWKAREQAILKTIELCQKN